MKKIFDLMNFLIDHQYLFHFLLNDLKKNPAVNHVVLRSRADQNHALMDWLMNELNKAVDRVIQLEYQYNPNQISHDKKTFVLLLDFDGCSDDSDRKKALVSDVLMFLDTYPQVKRVVIMIASLRQSLSCDFFNAQRNASHHQGALLSCSELGMPFVELLGQALCEYPRRIQVSFDPLLMGDLMNIRRIGDTYRSLPLRFDPEHPPKIDPELFEWSDITKISTLLTFLCYIESKYKSAYVRWYDDFEEILECNYTLFEGLDLIPEGIIFDCARMNPMINELDAFYDPLSGQSSGIKPRIKEYRKIIWYVSRMMAEADKEFKKKEDYHYVILRCYLLLLTECDPFSMELGMGCREVIQKPQRSTESFFSLESKPILPSEWKFSEDSAFLPKAKR